MNTTNTKSIKSPASRSCLARLVRIPYEWKYGVRGGIRPPLGYGKIVTPPISYVWKLYMWRMESAIYNWTGLPKMWHNSFNANSKAL